MELRHVTVVTRGVRFQAKNRYRIVWTITEALSKGANMELCISGAEREESYIDPKLKNNEVKALGSQIANRN